MQAADITVTDLTPIPASLKQEISLNLEQFHRVFDVFWTLSSIFWVPAKSNIKTAAVCFPPGGRSHMMINPKFWNGLNEDEQLFIIIHECLHVMLDHGIRNAKNIPGATHRLINIAQDITINEMIVDLFGFARGLMREWRKYCWIETCFEDPSKIERNQVFEYYLKKLIENPPPEGMETIDEHGDGFGGFDDGGPDPMAQELGQYLSWDELQALIKSMGKEHGRGIGLSPFQVVLEQREPEKLDFNTIVKKLKRSKAAKDGRMVETWQRQERRVGGQTTMILPGHDEGKPHKTKLITLLFFDVSGSCMAYLEHFNKCRLAFEKEERLFDIRCYKYDTSVKEVKPGEKIGVGGGTSYDIIETECLKVEAETGRYPDCVVNLTDGAGNAVNPKHPNRWVWLLTPGAVRTYIHERAAAWPLDKVTF